MFQTLVNYSLMFVRYLKSNFQIHVRGERSTLDVAS